MLNFNSFITTSNFTPFNSKMGYKMKLTGLAVCWHGANTSIKQRNTLQKPINCIQIDYQIWLKTSRDNWPKVFVFSHSCDRESRSIRIASKWCVQLHVSAYQVWTKSICICLNACQRFTLFGAVCTTAVLSLVSLTLTQKQYQDV